MRLMIIGNATARWEKEGGLTDPQTDSQVMQDMGAFNEEVLKAGVLLAPDSLHPSARGAIVKFSGASRSVVDGPFTESKELIAGFQIWQVKSLPEAIEWVKRAPNSHVSDSEVEIPHIHEMEDFALALSDEQIRHKTGGKTELPRQTVNN